MESDILGSAAWFFIGLQVLLAWAQVGLWLSVPFDAFSEWLFFRVLKLKRKEPLPSGDLPLILSLSPRLSIACGLFGLGLLLLEALVEGHPAERGLTLGIVWAMGLIGSLQLGLLFRGLWRARRAKTPRMAPATHRSTRRSLAALAIGLVVVEATALMFQHRIGEEWHAYKLRNGTLAERKEAAKWFGRDRDFSLSEIAAYVEGPSPRATRALVAALEDDETGLRVYAAEGLCSQVLYTSAEHHRRFAEAAVPALAKALDDNHPRVQTSALFALMHLGPAAREAVGSLIQAAEDGNELRPLAMSALGSIGPDAAAAVPFLIEAAKDDDDVRYSAVSALSSLGPAARESIPTLIGLLGHEEPDVRQHVARCLGDLGRNAAAAVPALLALLVDDDLEVRDTALEALMEVDPTSVATVDPLVNLLERGDPSEREWAVRALRAIAPLPRATVAPLSRALQDEERNRARARRAGPPPARARGHRRRARLDRGAR